MADGTKIEWTEATWNPVTGCTRVSAGCDNCYIERTVPFRVQHLRFDKPGPGGTTGVDIHPERLHQPLRWRTPRRVFVNSLADLFHEHVPDRFIAEVFAIMALTARHTYQVLTKRHARMRALLASEDFREQVAVLASGRIGSTPAARGRQLDLGGQRLAGDSGHGGGWTTEQTPEGTLWSPPWPLPNVWLGVSVEDQQWADIRIPALLDTPAAVRWLSCEPLLGPVDLHLIETVNGCTCAGGTPESSYLHERHCGHEPGANWGLDWVVVGGETGPDARPMHPDWARSLRDQCTAASVPHFFKQHGDWWPIGPLYAQGDDEQEADDARMDAVSWEVDSRKQVVQLERSGHVADGYQPGDPRTWLMVRRGKKAAGRELDGRTWDDYPAGAGDA